MPLMPAHFTTTKLGRRKKRSKSAKQLQAEAEHEKFLAKLFKNRGIDKTNIKIVPKLVQTYVDDRKVAPTSDVIPGYCPKKETMVYNGERQLLGIATMHKSNMVPVFADNKQVAEDIARMRRG